VHKYAICNSFDANYSYTAIFVWLRDWLIYGLAMPRYVFICVRLMMNSFFLFGFTGRCELHNVKERVKLFLCLRTPRVLLASADLVQNTQFKGSVFRSIVTVYVRRISETCMSRCLAKWVGPCLAPVLRLLGGVYGAAAWQWRPAPTPLLRLSVVMSQYAWKSPFLL
jgi:hypothetical protein